MPQGDAISYSKNESEWNLGGKPVRNMVIVDVYTTWTILVGIFFPSVTGELFLLMSLVKTPCGRCCQ